HPMFPSVGRARSLGWPVTPERGQNPPARGRSPTMQRRSRLVAPLTLAALVLSGVGLSTASANAAATPVDIDIVAINDFHGRIEEGPAPSAPATTSQAGAAVLSTMVQSYRSANPNTSFVAAGDLIGASTFTSFIQQDQPTIDALN